MRIVSTATYLPEHRYRTEELLTELHLRLSDDTLGSIKNLNVHSRSFAYPISSIIDGNFRSDHPDCSFHLAELAARKIAYDAGEVGFLIACCNAHDYLCPNLSSMLLRPLGLAPDTKHCTLQGLGCTSFIVALQLAEHYVSQNRDRQVLIVTSEVNSMLFARDLRRLIRRNAELKTGSRDWVTVIEATLFGDGAAATLVSNAGGEFAIRPLLHVTNIDPKDYSLGIAGSSFYLSPEIPSAGIRYTRFLLEKLELDPKSFDKLLIHTGSRKILDSLLASVGCSPDVAQESYQILRQNGNLSGASLQFILQEAVTSGLRAGLILGFGLGFHAGAAAIRSD